MKRTIITTSLLVYSVLLFGQETKNKHLLKADTTWTQEIFTFPIGFAQEISLEGYEEAIFPPGWNKEESPEFWSYIFVWNVKATAPLTSENFESYLQYYFDGLMNIRDLKNVDSISPTNAVFVKSDEARRTSHYIGKIRLYEGRYTKKMMVLHVLATQHFCETEKKTVVVFKFSPKEFGNTIWNTLNAVPLLGYVCE